MADTPKAEVETPDRLFVQFYTHIISATRFDPREVHDNGKPVYQYLAAEPIRKALKDCYAVEFTGGVMITKLDWEALKDAVNGK